MAIPLGIRRNEAPRESYWRGDPSVDWEGTPEPDRARYERTGAKDALRLKPEAEPPTRITFRALTADERAIIDSVTMIPAEQRNGAAPGMVNLWAKRILLAFAVGCDLPDVTMPEGIAKHSEEHGIVRLSREVVNALVASMGEGLVYFYGGLVLRGSEATGDDFFQSRPVSTETSSAGLTAEAVGTATR